MRDILVVLQAGVILTTPVFFLAVLLVLWRIVRAAETTMAVAVHIKRQLEVVGRGGLAEGVRPTDQVLKAEELAKDVRGGPDAHHRR